MISVGIHENIEITKAEMRIDPQGDPLKDSLVVTLELATGSTFSLEDLTTAEENVDDGNSQEYYFWPFDTLDKDGKPVIFSEVIKRMKDYKAGLNHILSGYMVKDSIEEKWKGILFNGTGITPDNVQDMMVRPDIVNKVYKNISQGFIDLINPFILQTTRPKFRVKFIRQSKTKHFSRIPKYSPFWESMDIPKSQTKLFYTDWEKKNGFDSGVPSTDVPAPDSTPDPAEAKSIDDVFNTGSPGPSGS